MTSSTGVEQAGEKIQKKKVLLHSDTFFYMKCIKRHTALYRYISGPNVIAVRDALQNVPLLDPLQPPAEAGGRPVQMVRDLRAEAAVAEGELHAFGGVPRRQGPKE